MCLAMLIRHDTNSTKKYVEQSAIHLPTTVQVRVECLLDLRLAGGGGSDPTFIGARQWRDRSVAHQRLDLHLQ